MGKSISDTRNPKNKSGGNEMKKVIIVVCMLLLLVWSAYPYPPSDEARKMLSKGTSLYHNAGNPKKISEIHKSINVLSEVYKKYPNCLESETALMYKGICYTHLGDLDKAIEAYKTAIENFKMKGYSDTTYFYLGDAYMKKGDFENARKWFTACVKMCKSIDSPYRSPSKFPYKNALEALKKLKKPETVGQKGNGIKDALYKHYVLKNYDQAKNEYELFFKNLNSDVQESSEILRSGIKNYYQLLVDMELTNEFGPKMREIGIADSILKSIVTFNSGASKSRRRRRSRTTRTARSTKNPKKPMTQKKLKSSMTDNGDLLSIDVKNYQVDKVLEMIKNKKNVSIVYPKRFSKETVSLKFQRVDFRKVLRMIAQLKNTSFFESDESYIFENVDEASLKRKKKVFIKNITFGKFQSLILDKLDKNNYKLLSVTPEKKNSLTADFLITDVEGEKLSKLIDSRSSATYVLAFKLFEFSEEGEKLVSSPKLAVNEGSIGEIKVEGKKENEYSLMKIKTSVRKESPGLYNVKLNIELEKRSGKTESKSNSKSEFNTTGNYEYVIFDNFGKKKYRVELDVRDINSKNPKASKTEKIAAKKKKLARDTSLIKAAKHGHLDIVKMLIASGSDVNAKGRRGATALHGIILWYSYKPRDQIRLEIVSILIEAGASVNIKDDDDLTPLHAALHSRNKKIREKIANLLIAKGCDVNQSDSHGETPLMIAARNGDLECVKNLLKAGAIIAGKNKNQSTAIGLAAEYGKKEVVQALLKARKNETKSPETLENQDDNK